MKTPLCTVLLVVFLAGGQFAHSDGPPGPPGSEASRMKTMNQIEPRTPIHSLPYTITNSGAYYVMSNLWGSAADHGITINTSHVTLDINGYCLHGVSGSWTGIKLSWTNENVTIRNGSVRGWDEMGVDAGDAWDSALLDMIVSHNKGGGVRIGENSLLERCKVYENGHGWSNAPFSDGIATGPYCTIRDCKSRANYGSGIYADYGTRVVECTSAENSLGGIYAYEYCTIVDCLVVNNGADGITVENHCRVQANNCGYNGQGYDDPWGGGWIDEDGAGIRVWGFGNRIEDNNCSGNDFGIEVWYDQGGYNAGANLIVRNSAGYNMYDFDVSQDDYFGMLVGTNDIMGGTTGFDMSNPWVNFSF